MCPVPSSWPRLQHHSLTPGDLLWTPSQLWRLLGLEGDLDSCSWRRSSSHSRERLRYPRPRPAQEEAAQFRRPLWPQAHSLFHSRGSLVMEKLPWWWACPSNGWGNSRVVGGGREVVRAEA